MRITNNAGISLPLAVWLVHDEYDYINEANYVSVTSLMRPLRQLVLPARIPVQERTMDVEELIASSLGHAIHDSIEKAWLKGHSRAMKLLGYPEPIIERIAINPTDDEVRASNSLIPVYLEQRAFRKITVDGVTFNIGGKFDLVADGIVQDNKSTSVWSWIKGTRDDEHQLQMSLYRWLDAGRPEQGELRRIQEDYGQINYIFTDWAKGMVRSQANYPTKRVESKTIPLLSLADTEAWVITKLREYQTHRNKPEAELPRCTDEELWRSDPVYKYYSDPAKANEPGSRATKNFDTLGAANAFLAEKGKGTVVTKLGEPKRCGYCPAFDACSQKDAYYGA